MLQTSPVRDAVVSSVSSSPTLLVMAAGMGSRFGGLKQLEPFGPAGETLLDYSVFDALRAGFGRVVFIIRRDFEATFRERVARRFEGRVAVDYVFQELTHLPGGRTPPAGREKPWGTAHAVWCAASAIAEPFAVINADDFYGADAFAQLKEFFASAGGAESIDATIRFAMAAYRLADTLSEHGTVSRGVCRVGPDNRLEAIEELTEIEPAPAGAGLVRLPDGHERLLSPDTLVSMNCWGFTPAVFALLDASLERFLGEKGGDPKAECYLPSAIAEAVISGVVEVTVLPTRGAWFGVTHRDDRPRVADAIRRLVAEGAYPEQLWR